MMNDLGLLICLFSLFVLRRFLFFFFEEFDFTKSFRFLS